MKKRNLFFGIVSAAVATVALASCDSPNQLTYENSDGQKVTTTVSATNDATKVEEAVEAVVLSAKYNEKTFNLSTIGFEGTEEIDVQGSAKATSTSTGEFNVEFGVSEKASAQGGVALDLEKGTLTNAYVSASIDSSVNTKVTTKLTAAAKQALGGSDRNENVKLTAKGDALAVVKDNTLYANANGKVTTSGLDTINEAIRQSISGNLEQAGIEASVVSDFQGGKDLNVEKSLPKAKVNLAETSVGNMLNSYVENITEMLPTVEIDFTPEVKAQVAEVIKKLNISISNTTGSSITFTASITPALFDMDTDAATKNVALAKVNLTINTKEFVLAEVSFDASNALPFLATYLASNEQLKNTLTLNITKSTVKASFKLKTQYSLPSVKDSDYTDQTETFNQLFSKFGGNRRYY